MKYPKLKEIPTDRQVVDAFYGYNHNLRIGDGEFYDMKNLSSDYYPVLAPRPARGIYKPTESFNIMTGAEGMESKDSMYIVNHQHLYIDGHKILLSDHPKFPKLVEGEKAMVSMGAYLIILPDKVWIDTTKVQWRDAGFFFNQDDDGNELGYAYGTIDYTFSTYENDNDTKFTLGILDGEYLSASWESTKEPTVTDEDDGKLWLDISASPCVLKRYSAKSGQWTELYNTYLRIETRGIGKGFSEGDGVRIYGLDRPMDVDGYFIKGEMKRQLNEINGIYAILHCEDNAITISGSITEPVTIGSNIFVSRDMPNMDFVVESNNRLWGCRYGEDAQGNFINEIYASKLGDFKNWNSFQGTAQDSYAVSCGTDGAFTGAIVYQGYPIFFKEECMHKVYGSYPANYQVQTYSLRGVQAGCEKSLAIVNEVLYYKSRTGICAYDGSLPTEVSRALGVESYSNAAAGVLGCKYYVSMKDVNGRYTLFVYDAGKGLWHKEDHTKALRFCAHEGDLYYIDGDDLSVKSVLGTTGKDNVPVDWMAETGVMTESPDKQYISRLNIRMQLDLGATVHFAIQYDSTGDWETVCVLAGQNPGRTFTIPIRPKRCDHFRLRIYGVGNAKIYSIAKTIEQGSDV